MNMESKIVNNDSRLSSLLGSKADMPNMGLSSYEDIYKQNMPSMGGLEGMPQMPQGIPQIPQGMPQGMPQDMLQMQGMPQMPQGMPQMPQMPQGMPQGVPQMLQGMPQMTGLESMPQGIPQMTGLESMPTQNLQGAYSPTNMDMDVYSPTINGMGQNNMNFANPSQVEGLNQIPLHMRNDVLSSLNNIQMPQNPNPTMNMGYQNLPTMQEIQANGLGNIMQPNMQMQMPMQMPMQQQQQQPTISQNDAQNILSQLPEGYSGSIPMDMANNLPMIGGGEKKKL